MLTVLQVIPELDAGGAERTTVDVAAALTRAGGRALVASRGGRLAGELADVGGQLIVMQAQSKNPATIAANAARIAAIARKEGVDIIHARSRAPAWSALWGARAAGVGFVTTYHGTYNARSGLKRWYNSVMARGDRVIANSAFIADHIAAHHGALKPSVTVIPRGVDTAAFDPAVIAPERTAKLAQAWGLGARPERARLVFLLPGRLTRWKGQEVAIAALAKARARLETDPRQSDLMLIMPGDAQGRVEYEETLRAAIDVGGLGEWARLVGHCSDMPAAYALSDVVVSASTQPEAFGRVSAEGQVMSRPVIATDHGGSRETVVDGEGGYLVSPGDVDALAGAFVRVAQLSSGERLAMGERGAARARRLFAVETMQAATLAVYADLMESRT